MYDPLTSSALDAIYGPMSTKAELKRKKRAVKKSGVKTAIAANHLELKEVYPRTEAQKDVFAAYDYGMHLVMTGVAGTGKTYLAAYLGMRSIMDESSPYKKMHIFRSAVPSRDIGFLPGSPKDKLAPYEAPYEGIFSDLFNCDTAYSTLKSKRVVEFVPTSFVRGRTIEDSIVVIEEMQNMTDGELNGIITRLGNNTRLIMCGDHRQDDLSERRNVEQSGMKNLMRVFSEMSSIARIEFGIDDVQRSGFVKEYLRARLKIGLDQPLDA